MLILRNDPAPRESRDRWDGYVDRIHRSPANEIRIHTALDRAFRLRRGEARPYVVYCDVDRCAMTVTDDRKPWWFENIQRDLESQGLFDGLIIGSEGALFLMNEPGIGAVYQAVVQLDNDLEKSSELAACRTASRPRAVQFDVRPNLATHRWMITTKDADATTPFGVCARRVLDGLVATHAISDAASWSPVLAVFARNAPTRIH